ncbi:MAG: hypothetical protein II621_07445 [Clostridia bacterium]|nr:hypothetical protein [Clostridia bacterium]
MDQKIDMNVFLDAVRASVAPVPAGRVRSVHAHGRVLSEDISAEGFSMPAGTWLDSDALAAIAKAGCLREGMFFPAYHPVRVSLLCLENEAANAILLRAHLRELGFSAEVLAAPAADDADALADVLWMAVENTDFYIVTGGGDMLADALQLLEAETVCNVSADVRLSSYRRCPVLALPGDPAAASSAFRTFAPAALMRRAGCSL